jgi:hypothetical protein
VCTWPLLLKTQQSGFFLWDSTNQGSLRSSGGVEGETCVIKNMKRSEKGRNMQCEGRKRGVMWLNGIV